MLHSDVGITEIGIYVPSDRESNYLKMDLLHFDENFIRTKLGVEFVSRKRSDEETSDMCVAAFHELQNKREVDLKLIDCLVVVTQNPDGSGLPHTSAIVHGKLGCRSCCAAFDISLGCSGFVYALSIVRAFMLQNGMKQGIVFTADPYSKIIDPGDRNTVGLFGDAAAATLLTDAPVLYPTVFAFGTRGQDGAALRCDHGVLHMDGRDVFNFSATEVPTQIRQLLEEAGKSLGDLDLCLLHQGSRFIVETITRKLGLPEDKVPVRLLAQGNTVSSSIPLLLSDVLHDSSINTVLISGFGVGLSWASAILQRKGR